MGMLSRIIFGAFIMISIVSLGFITINDFKEYYPSDEATITESVITNTSISNFTNNSIQIQEDMQKNMNQNNALTAQLMNLELAFRSTNSLWGMIGVTKQYFTYVQTVIGLDPMVFTLITSGIIIAIIITIIIFAGRQDI
jgi:hypothetical protein